MQQCVIKGGDGDSSKNSDVLLSDWMPLLLIIPLRLGLSEINPVYLDGLKVNIYFCVLSLVPHVISNNR